MEIAEPTFPLSPAAFKAALASGHGRAMQHAERHGLLGFEESILDATRYSWVYDSQCNGYAAEWLAKLCRIAGVVDQFVASDSLEGDPSLRCALLKEFVLMGYEQARPTLYAACRCDHAIYGLAGANEIVELDGEAGFLFVVRKIGALLQAGSDIGVDGEISDLFDSQAGQGRALELLEEGCGTDPAIAAYYWEFQELLKRVAKREAEFRPDPSLAEMIERIHLGGEKLYSATRWGNAATSGDRQQVAAMDFKRLPVVGLWNYLHYFAGTGFPVLNDGHLELLEHPDEGVRDAAGGVLSHHADERVRQAALRALAAGESQLALELFRNSAREEDLSAILRAVDSPATLQDEHTRHSAVLALLDLMAGQGAGRDLNIALWIYEHSPCMICREGAVKVMRELPHFPDWVAQECLHDARKEIRSLVATQG